MIDAGKIKSFADGSHGRKISLSDLLRHSNPFHCMFCCPMTADGIYFQRYFRSQADTDAARSNDTMPAYTKRLLRTDRQQEGNAEGLYDDYPENNLPPVRAVGVYDLRHEHQCQVKLGSRPGLYSFPSCPAPSA